MTRKISTFSFVLLFLSAFSFAGCGGSEGFEESEAPTVEEQTDSDDYMESMEADQERMQQEYKN